MNLQVVGIIRKDLGFNEGLLGAQVAHIMMEEMRSYVIQGLAYPEHIKEWLHKPYMYVYEVNNKESLELLIDKANKMDIPVFAWRDTVRIDIGSGMEAVSDVLVGLTFGVQDSDRVKPLVGNLSLLGRSSRT